MGEFKDNDEDGFDQNLFDQDRDGGADSKDDFVDHGIFPPQPDELDFPARTAGYPYIPEDDYSDGSVGQEEHGWLLSCQAQLDRDPRNPVLLRMRDEATSRYYRKLATAHGDQGKVAQAATQSADLLDSPDVDASTAEFLAFSAILIGVAILSGGAAGAAGAALVGDVASKEVVKGAVAGLITSAATLATERMLERRALQARIPENNSTDQPVTRGLALPTERTDGDARGATPRIAASDGPTSPVRSELWISPGLRSGNERLRKTSGEGPKLTRPDDELGGRT